MIDQAKALRRRLRAHFAFTHAPFTKHMWASKMFDSQSQRELLQGLHLWTEIKGLALVTGPAGVGKSITLRRFLQELDEQRFWLLQLAYLPTTVHGFLRSLCRTLGLPMRQHSADLFTDAQRCLGSHEQEHGLHPVLTVDDAEGLSTSVIDVLRRLTCQDLDAEDHFSILLTGTDRLLRTLWAPELEPLRSRVGYALNLRPFSIEDTRNYVRFHLERCGANPSLFSDQAVRSLFQASLGRPRNINQLALQCLIQAAVEGRDSIDANFVNRQIDAHPLYEQRGAKR